MQAPLPEKLVGSFRISDGIFVVDGVILSVAVLQAERRISATTLCAAGDLLKARALRDGALLDSEFKLSHYGKQGGMDEMHLLAAAYPSFFHSFTTTKI